MIKNGVYILKEKGGLIPTLQFNKGQEFEVVDKVIYINGRPLPFEMQNDLYKWMGNNLNLFINDTRDF